VNFQSKETNSHMVLIASRAKVVGLGFPLFAVLQSEVKKEKLREKQREKFRDQLRQKQKEKEKEKQTHKEKQKQRERQKREKQSGKQVGKQRERKSEKQQATITMNDPNTPDKHSAEPKQQQRNRAEKHRGESDKSIKPSVREHRRDSQLEAVSCIELKRIVYKQEVCATLIGTQAFVAPMDIDIGAKVHWVPESFFYESNDADDNNNGGDTQTQSGSTGKKQNNKAHTYRIRHTHGVLRRIAKPCALFLTYTYDCPVEDSDDVLFVLDGEDPNIACYNDKLVVMCSQVGKQWFDYDSSVTAGMGMDDDDDDDGDEMDDEAMMKLLDNDPHRYRQSVTIAEHDINNLHANTSNTSANNINRDKGSTIHKQNNGNHTVKEHKQKLNQSINNNNITSNTKNNTDITTVDVVSTHNTPTPKSNNASFISIGSNITMDNQKNNNNNTKKKDVITALLRKKRSRKLSLSHISFKRRSASMDSLKMRSLHSQTHMGTHTHTRTRTAAHHPALRDLMKNNQDMSVVFRPERKLTTSIKLYLPSLDTSMDSNSFRTLCDVVGHLLLASMSEEKKEHEANSRVDIDEQDNKTNINTTANDNNNNTDANNNSNVNDHHRSIEDALGSTEQRTTKKKRTSVTSVSASETKAKEKEKDKEKESGPKKWNKEALRAKIESLIYGKDTHKYVDKLSEREKEKEKKHHIRGASNLSVDSNTNTNSDSHVNSNSSNTHHVEAQLADAVQYYIGKMRWVMTKNNRSLRVCVCILCVDVCQYNNG